MEQNSSKGGDIILIITSGLPASGKSKVIDILARHTERKWHIIRPSDWIPENLAMLDEEAQRQFNIGCWSVAIDKCNEAIAQVPPRDIIVLDACNSKAITLLTPIASAKTALHHVVLLFIQSNSDLCLARNPKLTKELLMNYVERFKVSLPRYKATCDSFLVVQNNGIIEQLETTLYDTWKQLCQNI